MNLAAMRAAAADVDEFLGGAITLIEEEPATSAADIERVHGTAGTYVQLARAALERFEEAARGT